jgi:hypothetical protein
MSKIETAFDANSDLGEGLAVLSTDEWLNLSAFTDNAIYFNPSTEKMLRAAINLKPTEALVPEFVVTIQKYARLKGYCQTFDSEILPGTREVAASVIQYARGVPRTYDALTAAIMASAQGSVVNITLEHALAELSKAWQSSHPSQAAKEARKKFVTYIGILKQDAEVRAGKATALDLKLGEFHRNLKSSNAEFVADAKNYERLFGALNPKVQQLKQDLDLLQKELTGMRKQESDFIIVLETAPLYLLIPWFGYLIMAGVLSGVGGALGTLRNRIWENLDKAIKLNDELGPKEKFMAHYHYGEESTAKTAKEAEKAAKFVEKIKNAWSKIASDLTDLNTRLLADANQSSLTGAWDVANVRLGTAKDTWQDLKVDAEQYLRYQLRRADNLDDAMGGVVVKEAS